MELGKRLQHLRRLRRLTQKEMGLIIGVHERVISNIENGTRPLNLDEVHKVEEHFDLNLGDIVIPLEVSSPGGHEIEPPEARWMNEAEYTLAQQTFIGNLNASDLDVCLIGPDTLHLSDSAGLRKTWVDNISKGANYRIIWFLGYVLDGTFRNIGPALREVGEQIKNAPGRIIHYATFDSMGPEQETAKVKSDRNAYKTLEQELQDCKNEFHLDLGEFSNLQVRRSLLKYWNSFSSITVVVPHQKTRKAMASLTLRKVLPTAGANEVDTWLFFNREHVHELADVMDDLRKLCTGGKS